MSTTWSALHAQLVRSSERLSFHEHFTLLTKRNAALAGFAHVPALMDHQHHSGGDPARKDAVLRALVIEAQRDGPEARTAQVLVMLALWPGLDALHGRLRRHYPGDAGRLCSDLSAGILQAIAVADSGRISRMAATLLLNVRRDIMRGLEKEWARPERSFGGDDPDSVAGCEGPGCRVAGTIGRLSPIIGRDAPLVAAVVVMGATQREAGVALGLSHETARKRYQRAMNRLRSIVAVPDTA